MSASLAGLPFETRFAVPSGSARDVRAHLETAGASLARARVAALLGDPDPFHLLRALAEAPPDARVEGCDGIAPGEDTLLASLVAAAERDPGADPERLAGLFAFTAPGPAVRAVPVVRGMRPLRWGAHGRLRTEPPPAARLSGCDSWSTVAIGDAHVATVRVVQPLPDGGVALGSDYGLTLAKDGGFTPFPWPVGARREARRVEAMAVHAAPQPTLHVATSQARYTWDFRARVTSQRHPADREEGTDDLNALCSVGGTLWEGWRTRLVGGRGPADVLSFAVDPAGVVYAGTRHGELHVLDAEGLEGTGPLRVFGGEKRRPVRHLAFARDALWVAADGALHRFDGSAWSTLTPEPTALCTDPLGRLWAIAEGALWAVEGPPGQEVLVPMDLPLERPWSLGAVGRELWIGGVQRVWRVRTET